MRNAPPRRACMRFVRLRAAPCLVMAAFCCAAATVDAAASCRDGGGPAYADVTYISVGRFTLIAPKDPQFSMEIDRRWAAKDAPGAKTDSATYDAILHQNGTRPLRKGRYFLDGEAAERLFSDLLRLLEAASFYNLYLSPAKVQHLDGPSDSVTLARCGIETTLTSGPLGDVAREVPDTDDVRGKRFLLLLEALQQRMYAAPWHYDGPQTEGSSTP